ncbi:hypothetical protein ACJMK2_031339 [Sinanodonta woodiana]|uniref:Uncharacterized protein n=1 Tax=Sinanodonta woodiana TaxID=1069815 RepID=A0ABD3WYG7_SINWO
MEFAGLLCFLSVYALSLALPADPTAKDVQTQSPLVMENEDTRSVVPEDVDKYYWSKLPTPPYGYMWKYKLVPVFVDPRVPHIEYTLVEDQSSEINPQDLQEDAPENAEKSSVDKAMQRLKRQASWGIGGSLSIPLGRGGAPSWSVHGHGGYQNPSFGLGARAGIGGEFGRPPATSFGGYVSGTDRSGITGVLGGGWHSRAGTTFGLGAGYRGLGGHIDHQNRRFSVGAGSMPNLDPSRHQNPRHGSHG